MSTSVRTRPITRMPVSEKSAWRTGRFQRFCGIVTASALLFCFVTISQLQKAVDEVSMNQIPYIQGQLTTYEGRLHHRYRSFR